jgi:hypothetical protein
VREVLAHEQCGEIGLTRLDRVEQREVFLFSLNQYIALLLSNSLGSSGTIAQFVRWPKPSTTITPSTACQFLAMPWKMLAATTPTS